MRILLSRVQLAREEAVDDLAVLTTGSRRHYLDALLAFADARPIFAVTAFARRRHLLHRMLVISKESVMSSQRLVASFAGLLLAVLASAWAAAAAFPLAAQSPRDQPPPPPPAPAAMEFVPASVPDMEAAIRREPQNPVHYQRLAQYYVKQGDFDRAISTLESLAQADPSNPQHHHIVGVFYWEKAFRDASLSPTEKMTDILSGIAAEDRAMAIEPNFKEALIYKNILLRLQANHTTDATEQRRLIAEADALRNRAMELAKQQGVTVAPRGAMGPPPPPPPPPPAGPVDGMVPVRVGGSIPPPTKVRHVNPEYPEWARANKVEGVVILELVIDAAGAVREARVLRSITGLDDAAVEAVRQWLFTPTIVGGAARPVLMTVTVNFTLS
jgi:TonB family protein